MPNPAAFDPAAAAELLSHAQHLFAARRTGPFHVAPGEEIQAALEPGGIFADPLQFLLQSLNLNAVMRNVAPQDVPPAPAGEGPFGLPLPSSPAPAAVAGPLNAVIDALTNVTKVQPRLRVTVRWIIERIPTTGGAGQKIDEWDVDLDDAGTLDAPALAARVAPTRLAPLLVSLETLPLGDVLCVRPQVLITLDEVRLRFELPGLLHHALPLLVPTVLITGPHPNFSTDPNQPMAVAVPADSPINSIEALQDTVERLRDRLRPRGIGRFALWAAGLGFLVDLLRLPNPLVFVKGTRMDKLDAQDFTEALNDRANAVALFGFAGAAATLSSRDRVGAQFVVDPNDSDPGLLHLRVGAAGFLAIQNLKKTDRGGYHAKNAPRGELLPAGARLAIPANDAAKRAATQTPPDPNVLSRPADRMGVVTVVQSDDRGDGFQDSLTAWTFEDINPVNGQPFQPAGGPTIDDIARFACGAPAPPVLEQFVDGKWVPLPEGPITTRGKADLSVGGKAGTHAYTAVVTNLGPAEATDVRLEVRGAGVTFSSPKVTQGRVTGSGGQLACTLGTLAKGAKVTLQAAATPESTDWEVTAKVTCKEADPNPDNNVDTQRMIG